MSEEYPDWQDGVVKVVSNGDRVCSIWPADFKNAPGWEDVGFTGTRDECLEYVKAHCDAYCRLVKSVESPPQPPQDGPPSASPDAVGLAAD